VAPLNNGLLAATDRSICLDTVGDVTLDVVEVLLVAKTLRAVGKYGEVEPDPPLIIALEVAVVTLVPPIVIGSGNGNPELFTIPCAINHLYFIKELYMNFSNIRMILIGTSKTRNSANC